MSEGRWGWLQGYTEIAKRKDGVPNDRAWDAEQSLQSFVIPVLRAEASQASNFRALALWATKLLIWPGGWFTLIHWLIGLFGSVSISIYGIGVIPPLMAIAFVVWVCKRDKATSAFAWIALALAIISISFFAIHLF